MGTSASIPTTQRALSAVAVRRNNELLLFDCGEGTQRQMIQAKVGFHKLTKVFITHLHGDHVLGLPGLLQTMSLMGRTKKIEVYGPVGIKKFVEAIDETVPHSGTFEVQVFEKQPGIVCEEKEYTVEATESIHLDPSLVYAFIEKPRPGRFNTKKAQELGVPQGPLWSKLQNGVPVTLPDGTVVNPQMVLGNPCRGRKIVYTGDAGYSEQVVELAKNADVLIHESTFEDKMTERAIEDGHSTPGIAARTAKEAGVKLLILTHISARYNDAAVLLEQAKQVFANTEVAHDFLKVEIEAPED